MRVWTIQDKAAYGDLCDKGVLRCDTRLSEYLTESSFEKAYGWLASEMKERVGQPPKGVEYPIWAWYLLSSKNVKPDLRRYEFRGYEGEHYIIEAEIPDEDVLLSDEVMWHHVLNDWYIAVNAEKDDITPEYEADDVRFDNLPPDEQECEKRRSWEKVFDKNCCPWDFVQATFWELRKEQIISVRKFIGRHKPTTQNEQRIEI
jgi:hypothetical protein